ncbi:hypothetical protein [Labilibaculum manganireducens]|uniref:hypothetical protein n=1 Tax=Labilibaculum manganireducens TaxID=1940525 RepID=UPI0029F57D43|nr:hypothetical protein [Labilibaculum manganireducens]
MKTLNSKLFEKNKIGREFLNSTLGGKKEVDGCYSGSGEGPHGCCQEYCVVYDDGSFEIKSVPCD